ncbi:hypothetical protein ES288_D13G059300v1 [Gossypium darwinii]|uniref:Uncharacterized protein n=2 Tax=Gossypium TaxID=3633 RepID=A0A5D2HTM6_GOSTO|nr:hypothetical protein ES288_D13G059300v1 [Gossypium darwinii]TYH33433.1 hypothetical protein ES332_D13G058900v1 [Gossypium tomentosum]
MALSFSSINVGQAARHLQQLPPMPTLPTATLPPLPSIPNLPQPTIPTMPGLGRFHHFLPCLLFPHGLLCEACPRSQLQFPLFLSFLHHLLLLPLKNPFWLTGPSPESGHATVLISYGIESDTYGLEFLISIYNYLFVYFLSEDLSRLCMLIFGNYCLLIFTTYGICLSKWEFPLFGALIYI